MIVPDEVEAGKKRYVVQVVRTDVCYLYVDIPEDTRYPQTDALEAAEEIAAMGMINEDDWDCVDGYQYYVVQQYKADNSL